MKLYPHEPDYAVPPGATFQEWMKSQSLTLSDYGCFDTADFLESFIKGNEEIDSLFAEWLEGETGIPARFWLNLERNYRARLEVNDDKQSL